VQVGDLVGVHYPISAGNIGVVPYSDSNGQGAGVTPAMLSVIHNSNTRHESLTVGVSTVSGVEAAKFRLPALKAFVGPGPNGKWL